MTETGGGAWRQSIYYPFMHASAYGRGTVLSGPAKSEKYDSKEYSDIPYLESVSVLNEEKNELTIFAVNRNLKESIELEANIHDLENLTVIEHITLNNKDLKAVNSVKGEKVKPAVLSGAKLENSGGKSRLDACLPPASWNVIRMRIRP
jgi:alpha-N-arabinofuranosidase